MNKIIALLLVLFLSVFCISSVVSGNMSMDPEAVTDVQVGEPNL